MVSILVIVDDALEVNYRSKSVEKREVSILVIVDDALEDVC